MKINIAVLPEHVAKAIKEEVLLQLPNASEETVLRVLENYPDYTPGAFFTMDRVSNRFTHDFRSNRYFWNEVFTFEKYHLIPNKQVIEQDGEVYNI